MLEKIDSAGLFLKYVFGAINMEEDDAKVPVAGRKENLEKFSTWLLNLDVWGSF